MISEYLHILLHEHDCVVVAGLGGFISNENSSRYLPDEHRFEPVQRKVLFNRQLKTNDGLLAGLLAEKKKIDYKQALQEILRFSEGVKEEVRNGKQVELKNLGRLFLNEEGVLSFETFEDCNVSISAYGLSSLQLRPVKGLRSTQKEKKVSNGKARVRWTVAASFTVLLAISAYMLRQSGSLPPELQLSSLNPLEVDSNLDQQRTAPVQAKNEMPVAETEITSLPETDHPLEVKETPAGEIPSPSTISAGSDSVYYIVVGAFGKERNARKYEQELIEKGFSALIHSGAENTLIRVCAEKHTQRFEAEERLTFIKKTANPQAWIMAEKTDN